MSDMDRKPPEWGSWRPSARDEQRGRVHRLHGSRKTLSHLLAQASSDLFADSLDKRRTSLAQIAAKVDGRLPELGAHHSAECKQGWRRRLPAFGFALQKPADPGFRAVGPGRDTEPLLSENSAHLVR